MLRRTALHDLAAVRDLERDLRAIGSPGADLLASAVAALLDGSATTWADALGEPGRRQAGPRLRRQERDTLLREHARRYALRPDALAAELARFASTVWPRLRLATDCPPALVGHRQELLWRILRLDARPVSRRQLSRVLAMEGGEMAKPLPDDRENRSTP